MIIDLAQNYVAYIINKIVASNRSDFEILERDISKIENISVPFPLITYDDALDILRENNSTLQ